MLRLYMLSVGVHIHSVLVVCSRSSLCLCLSPAAGKVRWTQGKACGAAERSEEGPRRGPLGQRSWVLRAGGLWVRFPGGGVLYIYYARARRPQTKAFWAWVGAPLPAGQA